MYDAIMSSFDALPIAAMLEDSFFCVHGGLSPSLVKVADINKIERFQEIPREGMMWYGLYFCVFTFCVSVCLYIYIYVH